MTDVSADDAVPAKKAKKVQPTQRTMQYMRDEHGAMVGVVEKWNMHAKPHPRRVDLFGFIDIVAIVPGVVGAVGIQCTAASGISARIHKVLDETIFDERKQMTLPNPIRSNAIRWCEAGNKVLFHGWKKGSNGRWSVDEREMLKTPRGWEAVKAGEPVNHFLTGLSIDDKQTTTKENNSGNPF